VNKKKLISVYCSLVYSHLIYEILPWGNTAKPICYKQVKQNLIIKFKL